ncbi:hypothetical protein C0J52_13285 [Blattella germanica]|nr:hypothetical protein C0J52_13285 [Blattella germanica]
MMRLSLIMKSSIAIRGADHMPSLHCLNDGTPPSSRTYESLRLAAGRTDYDTRISIVSYPMGSERTVIEGTSCILSRIDSVMTAQLSSKSITRRFECHLKNAVSRNLNINKSHHYVSSQIVLLEKYELICEVYSANEYMSQTIGVKSTILEGITLKFKMVWSRTDDARRQAAQNVLHWIPPGESRKGRPTWRKNVKDAMDILQLTEDQFIGVKFVWETFLAEHHSTNSDMFDGTTICIETLNPALPSKIIFKCPTTFTTASTSPASLIISFLLKTWPIFCNSITASYISFSHSTPRKCCGLLQYTSKKPFTRLRIVLNGTLFMTLVGILNPPCVHTYGFSHSQLLAKV